MPICRVSHLILLLVGLAVVSPAWSQHSGTPARARSAIRTGPVSGQKATPNPLPSQGPCAALQRTGSTVTVVADGGPDEPYDSLRVHEYVRYMPELMAGSGTGAIGEMLQCLVVVPAEVQAGRTEGLVYVNFTVNRDGTITGARIEKGLSPACDAAALAAAARLPRLVPGRRQNNQPAAVALTLALEFFGPRHVYDNWRVAQGARFPAPGVAAYVRRNRRVPAPKQERKSPRVLVDFVVGADGRVREPRVQQSVSARADQEALRLVRAMPRWVPARTYQGQAVAVREGLVLVVSGPGVAPRPR